MRNRRDLDRCAGRRDSDLSDRPDRSAISLRRSGGGPTRGRRIARERSVGRTIGRRGDHDHRLCFQEAVAEGKGFSVGGMAKGAAMLSPNMATMLAVLTTDAAVDPAPLQIALASSVAASFNELTVDGCTSTNDTVIVLASGRGSSPSAHDWRPHSRKSARRWPFRWPRTWRARRRSSM